MRRACRCLLFGFCIAALAVAGGCSEGDSIPVQPVGLSLDATADPNFRVIAPLSGGRSLYDCAQLEDGLACIVGQDGLILERLRSGRWYRAGSPTENHLGALCVGPDDRLWAVGTEGTVLVRDAGGWRAEATGTEETLRAVWAGEEEVWAAGDAGTVLRRTGGVWEQLECPVETDLYGIWGESGVRYVCGYDGTMLRYGEGAWTDESDGPWGTEILLGIVRPEGGDLFAVSRPDYYLLDPEGVPGLHRRTSGGWQTEDLPATALEFSLQGLKAAGADLWIESGWQQLVRLRPGDGSWIVTEIRSSIYYGTNLCVGPAAGRDILLVGGAGGIDWIDAQDRVHPDPAGATQGNTQLFRMADGTSGFVDERGLFYWRDGELHGMRLDYADDETGNRYVRAVDGLSIDDFFVSTQDGVYHLVDGTATWRLEPEYDPGEFELAVGGDGDLFFYQRDGVVHLPPGASELETIEELGWSRIEMRRLRSGRVAAWNWFNCYCFENGAWTTEQLPVSPDFVWEAADGVMGLYNSPQYITNTPSLHFWKEGTSGTSVVSQLVSGSGDLTPRDLRVGELGLYACTSEPSRIFHLDDSDLLAGRWDAVTGLYAGYAGDYLPLDDGSLLVIDTRTDEILLYRDRD